MTAWAPLPGETVTLLRRTRAGTDPDGNDAWVTAEVPVAGCVVWPRASSELVEQQDTVIVGLSVLLPPATVVLATDRVRVRGDVYEVDGQPAAWTSPFDQQTPGVQAALTRATG